MPPSNCNSGDKSIELEILVRMASRWSRVGYDKTMDAMGDVLADEKELQRQAIHEPIRLVPYDPVWPAQFDLERGRLTEFAPELLAIEHIGSTAVPGLAAKPVIDIIAAVATMEIADELVDRLCANGYITSADFNRTLGDRRWLMRHADGRRTYHLHLVLPGSTHWSETIRFRDVLRHDAQVAKDYLKLKETLAGTLGNDRDAYTAAKTAFIVQSANLAVIFRKRR